MDGSKKKVLNLSSGVFGTMRSNYYKMGIRNFLFTKDDDGGTFRAECVMEVDHRNAEEFIVPVFHDSRNGRKISTPITATYQRLSSANVRISYGNHSRPCVIRILRRKGDGI